MRGNFAAFSSVNEQMEFKKKLEAKTMTWSEVYDAYK